MKIILATYFYPQGIKYINSFLGTIEKQSCKDFKLIVFNDGLENIQRYFEKYAGEKEIVNVSGTPTQIRFQSFEYLSGTAADKIIFQDVDDEMSTNRIEILARYLEKYDVVSNDLDLMNEDGIVFKKNVWSQRLKNGFEFDHTFIKEKNIVGIGNSGIRRTVLNTPIKYSSLPKVADWFMFYQLLFSSGLKAVFTNDCRTFYRQHDANMAGIKKPDAERISYVLDVKKAHYKGLTEIGLDFKKELNDLSLLEKNIPAAVKKNKMEEENLFWWEETKYLQG